MKVKLSRQLCYFAGLQSRFKTENGEVGIKTNKQSLEEHFVSMSLNDFKIPSNKILIEENENGSRHIFFYHSKLNKEIKQVIHSQTTIFKLPTPEARSFIAGIFDASGHFREGSFFINRLSKGDQVMLETLKIHLKGNRILNNKAFLSLIKGFSVVVEEYIN